MKARMVAHLVNGSSVAGQTAECTKEESEQAKAGITDLLESKPADGWAINLESANGSWAVIPRSSVLYLEFEVRDIDEDRSARG